MARRSKRENPAGGKYPIRRGDQVGNYTVDDIAMADRLVIESMANSLWEDCLVSLRAQRYEDGDEIDIVLAKGSEAPEACYTAARSILTLWAAENNIGNPNEANELSLEVFNDAVEERDLATADAALHQINSVPFVFAVLAHRANQDQSFGYLLLERLGYYLYMEAVGHGVDWGDSPNQWRNFPRKKPRPGAEVYIAGNHLEWIGRASTGLRVQGSEDTEWDFGGDEARADEHRIATYYVITDPNDPGVLEEGWGQDPGDGTPNGELLDMRAGESTWVDAAVRFMREHDVAPIDVAARPFTDTDGFNFVGTQVDLGGSNGIQRIDFSLRGFTEEEAREVYARIASNASVLASPAAPHIIRTYEVERDADGDADEPDEREVALDPDPDETFVEQAVRLLRYDGAEFEASSSPTWSTGTWYMSEPQQDYRTGGYREKTFHLEGFTPEEEQAVYAQLMGR